MVRPWHGGRCCAPLPPPHSLHSQPWLLTESPGARTISGINILFNIAAVSEGTLAAQMALTSISQNCVLQKSDYEIRALRVTLVSQWPVLTDHIKPLVMFSAYFDTKCLLTGIRVWGALPVSPGYSRGFRTVHKLLNQHNFHLWNWSNNPRLYFYLPLNILYMDFGFCNVLLTDFVFMFCAETMRHASWRNRMTNQTFYIHSE